jgi:uncharacterized cupin superfamily protein
MPDNIPPTRTGILRIDPESTRLEALVLDPDAFQSPLPVQHYALIFEDEDIGLAVGIWDTTTMQEAFGPYPGDEYITVLDGGFAMVDAAGQELAAAQAGDSVTFRNGVPSSWKQDGYLRKIYVTLHNPDGATPEIASTKDGFRVANPGRLPTGNRGSDGVMREVIFRNDAGSMTVTLCAFQAQNLPLAPCPSHRLIRVLSGAITLTEPSGPPQSFGPNTHVFLPEGTVCGWAVTDGTVAVFVDVIAK